MIPIAWLALKGLVATAAIALGGTIAINSYQKLTNNQKEQYVPVKNSSGKIIEYKKIK